jgi:hypothetical protein
MSSCSAVSAPTWLWCGPVLLDIQRGRCFYCKRDIARGAAHVDQFMAWARYPVDLGHNFVLADDRCNSKKRERLPACEHLAAWTERNATYGSHIANELERRPRFARLSPQARFDAGGGSSNECDSGVDLDEVRCCISLRSSNPEPLTARTFCRSATAPKIAFVRHRSPRRKLCRMYSTLRNHILILHLFRV